MNAYYLDFTVTLYTTKVVMAESDEDARRIAGELAEDRDFFLNELLPGWQESEILQENMYVNDDEPGYAAVLMEQDADEDEVMEKVQFRYMSADDVAYYIGEE